jgi:MFS family permease
MSGISDGSPDNGRSSGIWSRGYLPITVANLTVVATVGFGGLALVAGLSTIAEDLGNVRLLPWVFTGYYAASAIAVVVAGPVIDAVGVRRTFRLTGIWLFATTTAAAVAPSMATLVFARTLQGLGVGMVFAVSTATVGLGYPHQLRPRAFAAQSVVFGVMGLGGPALAGVMLAFGGWRVVFLAQLPVIAIALASGWLTLPTTRDRPARIQTDWRGTGLLTFIVCSSLTAVSQVGVRWWAVGAAMAVTAVVVRMYWWHSGLVDAPVLAREHLNRFPLKWVHATSGMMLFVVVGSDNFLPLYVQTARGRSVEFAAFTLVFAAVGWTFGSLAYSRLLVGWREAEVIRLGCWLVVPFLGLAGTTVFLIDWPLSVLFGALTFVGVSVGLVTTAGLTLLQASGEQAEIGRLSAAHEFVRSLATMYGVALAGAILLLVVDVRVGDVDAVRDVIAGEDIALGSETNDAIRYGVAWGYVAVGTIAMGCLLVGTSLVRRTRRLAA